MRPSSTATVRLGSQCSASRSQTSFMLAGQTTTVGKRVVRLDRRERLHGLAEPLLVGDEGAPPRERVAHAGALEGVQLAAELEAVELGVLGVRQRDGLGGALVLRHELLEQLARRLLDVRPRGAPRGSS